jgi:hypothetical protein
MAETRSHEMSIAEVLRTISREVVPIIDVLPIKDIAELNLALAQVDVYLGSDVTEAQILNARIAIYLEDEVSLDCKEKIHSLKRFQIEKWLEIVKKIRTKNHLNVSQKAHIDNLIQKIQLIYFFYQNMFPKTFELENDYQQTRRGLKIMMSTSIGESVIDTIGGHLVLTMFKIKNSRKKDAQKYGIKLPK